MQNRHVVVWTNMVSRNPNKRNPYVYTQGTITGHLVLYIGRDTSFFGSIIVHCQKWKTTKHTDISGPVLTILCFRYSVSKHCHLPLVVPVSSELVSIFGNSTHISGVSQDLASPISTVLTNCQPNSALVKHLPACWRYSTLTPLHVRAEFASTPLLIRNLLFSWDGHVEQHCLKNLFEAQWPRFLNLLLTSVVGSEPDCLVTQ